MPCGCPNKRREDDARELRRILREIEEDEERRRNNEVIPGHSDDPIPAEGWPVRKREEKEVEVTR